MPCTCGDTMCPSCGPAQGYDVEYQKRLDILADIFSDSPLAVNQDWLIDYVAGKLGMILEKMR